MWKVALAIVPNNLPTHTQMFLYFAKQIDQTNPTMIIQHVTSFFNMNQYDWKKSHNYFLIRSKVLRSNALESSGMMSFKHIWPIIKVEDWTMEMEGGHSHNQGIPKGTKNPRFFYKENSKSQYWLCDPCKLVLNVLENISMFCTHFLHLALVYI